MPHPRSRREAAAMAAAAAAAEGRDPREAAAMAAASASAAGGVGGHSPVNIHGINKDCFIIPQGNLERFLPDGITVRLKTE